MRKRIKLAALAVERLKPPSSGRDEYADSRTIINPLMGERWFFSEEAAKAAGWRRSLR